MIKDRQGHIVKELEGQNKLLKKLKMIYPTIHFHIIVNNLEYIENLLLKNELDFALIETTPLHQLKKIAFYQDELVIVVHQKHPLLKVKDLKELAYKEGFELEKIKELLNKYGIYFVCEKALPGTKIRGCFKVKGKQPAVYVTDNYAGKDSFFFELFHELGHCKSDYNEGKNKIIIDGNEKKEEKADKFALEVMIPENVWNEIINGKIEKNKLEKISQTEKIPMSFIVGRLAKKDLITYRSRLYQDNYQK